jgi:DNA-binding GntR family transcriptional regulator
MTSSTPVNGNAVGRTISSVVAESLREDIHQGVIPPGTPLRQTEIAERYGVSTTPVREAFALLQREGVLVRADHKGVVVFNPTIDDLREVYIIRIPLESTATEHAVPNLTAGDFEILHQTLDQMKEASRAGDQAARATANRRFHQQIYQRAQLPRLYALIEDLRVSSLAYIRLFGVFHPDYTDAIQEHAEVIDACEQRDAVSAAELMRRHLESTERVVATGMAHRGTQLMASRRSAT